MTLGSQKYFIVNDMPRNISVRKSVCAEASSTVQTREGERRQSLCDGKRKLQNGKTLNNASHKWAEGVPPFIPPVRSVGIAWDEIAFGPSPTSFIAPALTKRERFTSQRLERPDTTETRAQVIRHRARTHARTSLELFHLGAHGAGVERGGGGGGGVTPIHGSPRPRAGCSG